MASGLSVLLAKPELPPLEKVAEVLARFAGGPVFDARMKAKHAWGFLGEKMSDADADRLSAVAGELGFETRVLPAEKIAVLPRPTPVHWMRATPEGVVYTVGTYTDERTCSWDRLRLLAAGGLKEQTTTVKTIKEGPSANERAVKIGITMVTGIPLGFGGGTKEVKKTVHETELFLHMDLLFDGAEGPLRLSVLGQQFNYAALGEARTASVLINFRTLLQSVDKFAGPALRNKGAAILLAGQPLNLCGYEGTGGYEKEMVWLLSLLAP
jgi:hypothetical protein